MPKQKIDPNAPIKEASDEVKKIMIQILNLEREHLYQDSPRLNSDVSKIIEEAVQ